MDKVIFEEIVQEYQNLITDTLHSKGKEYSGVGNDRLHNFRLAADLDPMVKTMSGALWGMLRKHLVSIIDVVKAIEEGEDRHKYVDMSEEHFVKFLKEKHGDVICYLILLHACLIEERNRPRLCHFSIEEKIDHE